MHAEITELLRQLDAAKREGHDLAGTVSYARLNWCPTPERWSAAECLDHLNVSVSRTLPALDRAIAAGRARGLAGRGPFRYGWLARMAVASMEPPPRLRVRRSRVFAAPRGAHENAVLAAEYARVRDALGARFRDADGLDLARVRVTSPVSRWIRMPLGAYFAFLVAHERRHLWQARQVLADPRCPA